MTKLMRDTDSNKAQMLKEPNKKRELLYDSKNLEYN